VLLFNCCLILVSICQYTVEDFSSSKGETFVFHRLKESFFFHCFPTLHHFCILVLEVLRFVHTFSSALAADTAVTKNLLIVLAVLRQKYLSAPQRQFGLVERLLEMVTLLFSFL